LLRADRRLGGERSRLSNDQPLVDEAFSVDSSSWLGKYGQIPVPRFINGRPDHRRSFLLPVTDRTRGQANHIDRLERENRLYRLDDAHQYLDSIGIDLGEVRYGLQYRIRTQINHFQQLAATTGTEFYFVTDATGSLQNALLTKAKANNRLLSWHKLRNQPADTLERYVSGKLKPPEPKPPKCDLYSDLWWEWVKLQRWRRYKDRIGGASSEF
jgi:hypothetical protein